MYEAASLWPVPAGDNSTPVAVIDQARSLCLPGDLMGM